MTNIVEMRLRGCLEVRGEEGRWQSYNVRSVKDCRDWFSIFLWWWCGILKVKFTEWISDGTGGLKKCSAYKMIDRWTRLKFSKLIHSHSQVLFVSNSVGSNFVQSHASIEMLQTKRRLYKIRLPSPQLNFQSCSLIPLELATGQANDRTAKSRTIDLSASDAG